MKTMKKLASVALALTLALALAAPALAAEVTIKLPTPTEDTDPNATESYKAYKIFDADVAGEEVNEANSTFDHVAYSISDNSPFYATVNGFAGITLTELREENGVKTFNVAVDDTFVAADLAAALQAVVTAEGFTGEAIEADKAATLTENATLNLTDGYFLIVGTLGSKAILDTVGQENVTITTKNDLPTIKKETPDIEGLKIGDKVDYTITVNAKPGASKYVVHDTMGIGLTFNNDVVIEGLTAGVDYNVVAEGLEDNCTFHVVFAQDYLNTIDAAKDIVITYSATINSNATISVDTTTNKATLDYGENGHTEESEDTQTETPLYSFDLAKTNSDQMGKEVLTGAEFSLYDVAEGGEAIALVLVEDAENGNYYRPATAEDATTTTVIEAGVVTIKGLGKGTYYLQEDVAPDGYNKLNARTPVELGPDKNLGEVVTTTTGEGDALKTIYVSGGLRIENLTGAELPSTGGMGTTLFYIGGGVLVAAAGILLITKKRMASEEE